MKRVTLALSLVAVMGLTACASDTGVWTPVSGGRTAGSDTVVVQQAAPAKHKADKTFSHEMHK